MKAKSFAASGKVTAAQGTRFHEKTKLGIFSAGRALGLVLATCCVCPTRSRYSVNVYVSYITGNASVSERRHFTHARWRARAHCPCLVYHVPVSETLESNRASTPSARRKWRIGLKGKTDREERARLREREREREKEREAVEREPQRVGSEGKRRDTRAVRRYSLVREKTGKKK